MYVLYFIFQSYLIAKYSYVSLRPLYTYVAWALISAFFGVYSVLHNGATKCGQMTTLKASSKSGPVIWLIYGWRVIRVPFEKPTDWIAFAEEGKFVYIQYMWRKGAVLFVCLQITWSLVLVFDLGWHDINPNKSLKWKPVCFSALITCFFFCCYQSHQFSYHFVEEDRDRNTGLVCLSKKHRFYNGFSAAMLPYFWLAMFHHKCLNVSLMYLHRLRSPLRKSVQIIPFFNITRILFSSLFFAITVIFNLYPVCETQIGVFLFECTMFDLLSNGLPNQFRPIIEELKIGNRLQESCCGVLFFIYYFILFVSSQAVSYGVGISRFDWPLALTFMWSSSCFFLSVCLLILNSGWTIRYWGRKEGSSWGNWFY